MEEMIEKFHKEHNRSYGYFNRSMRIQMVNYRVSAVGDIVKPDLKEERIQENAPAPEPFDVRNVLFDREKVIFPQIFTIEKILFQAVSSKVPLSLSRWILPLSFRRDGRHTRMAIGIFA